jgi:hypothetical protein
VMPIAIVDWRARAAPMDAIRRDGIYGEKWHL